MNEELPIRRPPLIVLARLVFLVLVVFALLFGYQAVALYTDWQWFHELRQPGVFSTRLGAVIRLYLGFGVLFFLLVYFNFWLALKATGGRPRVRGLDPAREQVANALRGLSRWIALGVALLLAFGFGGSAASHWSEYLQYTHASSFGILDPVFGRDVGFYVFRLPFLNYLLSFALAATGVSLAGVAAIHYLDHAADLVAQRLPALDRPARRHILALAGLFAFLFGLDYWLGRYELLYADNGIFFGAGYTDLHVRLPAMSLQMAAMFLTAGLCILNIWQGRPYRLPLIGLGIWAAVSALGMGILPGFTQRFTVVPNQFEVEKEYISRDLRFTQLAYGVDRVQEKPFPSGGAFTTSTAAADRATIENIRLWDWPQLGLVYTAKQALKNYYTFTLPGAAGEASGGYNIDVDRYRIGGRYRQVMLAAREIYLGGLVQSAQTWQNMRLQYTHGYGVVMSPVDRIDSEGLPEYLLGQIPVQASSPELEIKRPQIYFGEQTNEHVFTGTKQTEFDFPTGDGFQQTKYAGSGGVPLGGAISRFAWSVRLGDTNLLLSSELGQGSRILFRRNVRERVRAVAPFLRWDADPYLVVTGGRLVWMLDGYSVSDRYPYAKPYEQGPADFPDQFNYVRNSVKAVIDAYDGTVDLYVSDPRDPIIATWRRVFPGLFQPLDRMPDDLRAHIRYPEDLFRIQRDIYALYHITDPRIYYGRDDAWDVPADPTPATDSTGFGRGPTPRMIPYYVVMRLPEEKREEFLMMTPYTPLNAQNIAAWMCAKCDPEDYGQLLVYRFPKGRNVNGPGQIIAQIKSQPEISKTMSLLDQRGSRVVFGNLLAIPVDSTLLYAVPMYVQAAAAGAATIPQIKEVILATGDRIVMRQTLDQAVAALAQGGPAVAADGTESPSVPTQVEGASTTGPRTVPQVLQRANQAYQNARTRQREYGKALDDLGQALKDLQNTLAPSGRVPP